MGSGKKNCFRCPAAWRVSDVCVINTAIANLRMESIREIVYCIMIRTHLPYLVWKRQLWKAVEDRQASQASKIQLVIQLGTAAGNEVVVIIPLTATPPAPSNTRTQDSRKKRREQPVKKNTFENIDTSDSLRLIYPTQGVAQNIEK